MTPPDGTRGTDRTQPRLVDDYDAVLLDLDGVVYVGADAVPGAVEVIATLKSAGHAVRFLTNNASRPPSVVADHLRSLGIDAADDDVVTAAQAAARLVAGLVPAGSRVLVVGGAGLVAALGEHDLEAVTSFDDGPLAVVQGFAPEVGWRLLNEGVRAVRSGLPWVASNLDRTIPTATGIAPGNGLLVEVVRQTTGAEPLVAGKPERALVEVAVARGGAARPIIVGDRLDTDIAAAGAYGCDSMLVLTGVSTAADGEGATGAQRPTYIGADLRALLDAPGSGRLPHQVSG